VATRRLGAWPRDVSEAKAWWYLAVSTRRAWKSRSGYACRVLRRRTFGRGFDSRRLHQLSSGNPRNHPWFPAASTISPRPLSGRGPSNSRIAASSAAGLRCM